MSEEVWWYGKMLVLALILVALIVWIRRQVKHVDAAIEKNGIERDYAYEEYSDSLARKNFVNRAPPVEESDQEAFHLDDNEQPKSALYKKSESLGFQDKPEPPHPRAA